MNNNPPKERSSTPVVLLVEDDAALSGYLAAALQAHGYLVHSAIDRLSAMAVMETPNAPSLVLLDLGLPPHPSTMREGLHTLREILQMQPATKVLVLTGQDEAAGAHEAVRLGAFDFLVKPCALDTLLAALRRADLFVREEAHMAISGEARISITARIAEGPKEAGSQVEEQLLRRSWVATAYNVTEVARQLGLAREQVYYYLNKYGIRRPH